MKYEFHIPTEKNTEFFNGPVVFREDGSFMAFCNVHGHGQACVDELSESGVLSWEDGWQQVDKDIQEQVDVEGMFEIIVVEVE